MSDEIKIEMEKEFGDFCAVGGTALQFLREGVYPNFDKQQTKLVFDFAGVRNINSSFSNALFANLVRRYGKTVIGKITIVNAQPKVKGEISTSIHMAVNELGKQMTVLNEPAIA